MSRIFRCGELLNTPLPECKPKAAVAWRSQKKMKGWLRCGNCLPLLLPAGNQWAASELVDLLPLPPPAVTGPAAANLHTRDRVEGVRVEVDWVGPPPTAEWRPVAGPAAAAWRGHFFPQLPPAEKWPAAALLLNIMLPPPTAVRWPLTGK